MSLSKFEIAVGGISSIPVLAGLIFLAYKRWGEKNLDSSKLKSKKVVAKKKEPAPNPEIVERSAKKSAKAITTEKIAQTESKPNT